jgi:hypothetical protein
LTIGKKSIAFNNVIVDLLLRLFDSEALSASYVALKSGPIGVLALARRVIFE